MKQEDKTDVHLVVVGLRSEDGEEDWRGFLPDAGEPVEFGSLEEAGEAAEDVLRGTFVFSLMEPYILGPRPVVEWVEVVRAQHVRSARMRGDGTIYWEEEP